jgi:hypothetical protein
LRRRHESLNPTYGFFILHICTITEVRHPKPWKSAKNGSSNHEVAATTP